MDSLSYFYSILGIGSGNIACLSQRIICDVINACKQGKYSEIRNPKSETPNNTKTQNPNDQNVNVLNLEHLGSGYSGEIIPDL